MPFYNKLNIDEFDNTVTVTELYREINQIKNKLNKDSYLFRILDKKMMQIRNAKGNPKGTITIDNFNKYQNKNKHGIIPIFNDNVDSYTEISYED